MKTFILFLFFAFFISVSKAQTNDHFDSYSNEQLKSMAQQLAVVHGQGLSDVYDHLEQIIRTPITRENLLEDMNNSLDQHIKNYLRNNLSIDPVELLNFEFPIADDVESLSAAEIFSHANGQWSATQEFSNAIQQLNDILQQTSDAQQIENAITSLVQELGSTIENKFERLIFYGSSFVAINSAQYWKANMSEWENKLGQMSGNAFAFNSINADNSTALLISSEEWVQSVSVGQPKSAVLKIDGKKVIMADVCGAARGCITGALVGALGGTVAIPGVGTVAGAACCGLVGMARGMIVGSARNALMQGLRSLF